jgi:hypothetical protein
VPKYLLHSDSPITFSPIQDGSDPQPPPPVEPPVEPPPPTGEPFVWPPDYTAPAWPDARYRAWWLVPGNSIWDITGKAYAYESGTGNAVGSQHHNAGIIAAGPHAGLRLWAPYQAPGGFLRAILRGTL